MALTGTHARLRGFGISLSNQVPVTDYVPVDEWYSPLVVVGALAGFVVNRKPVIFLFGFSIGVR